MKFIENFRIALNALLLNPTRALLTMLGIIIGVAAVVSLMSMGRGVQEYVLSQFDGLGADLLTVRASRPTRGFSMGSTPLTMVDIEALSDPATAPSLKAVTAEYQVQATIIDGYTSVTINLRGVPANYAAVNDWQPVGGGAFFTQADVDAQAEIGYIGTSLIEDLFGDADYNPVGRTVIVNGRLFTIVGVMEERTATGQADPNGTMLIPISTAQAKLGNARIAGEGYSVSTILAQVNSTEGDGIEAATSEIETFLLAKHNIADPNQADFTVTSTSTIVESRTEILSVITLFLSGIAAISLLVGGIGMMNIMLVSVTERTREIGLRKAVGAQFGDILSQFLIESVLLSIAGGAGGILLSIAIIRVAENFLSGVPLSISLDVILLATGVSSAIGIFFGLYPARRAAKMRPIDALRFE